MKKLFQQHQLLICYPAEELEGAEAHGKDLRVRVAEQFLKIGVLCEEQFLYGGVILPGEPLESPRSGEGHDGFRPVRPVVEQDAHVAVVDEVIKLFRVAESRHVNAAAFRIGDIGHKGAVRLGIARRRQHTGIVFPDHVFD